jgi:hypothetical protein
MSDEDDDYSSVMKNPYRDDPVWEDWHATACGVQGGADDISSSESEEEGGEPVVLPTTCVCSQCRLVMSTISKRKDKRLKSNRNVLAIFSKFKNETKTKPSLFFIGLKRFLTPRLQRKPSVFSIPDPGSELSPSRIPIPHQRI